MPTFHVKWRVIEIVNGPGRHDGGRRDGDRDEIATGEIDKVAENAHTIRAELTAALQDTWPRHALGPTYDLDRVYEIEITPVGEDIDVLERIASGEFKATPLGTPTVIQDGDDTCVTRKRRTSVEHAWDITPVSVEDIDEEEMAKPGVAFPMATFRHEYACHRCKRIEIRAVRALL